MNRVCAQCSDTARHYTLLIHSNNTDYAKYDCDLFDLEHKAKMRDEQFPKDMEKAYEIGKRLATITKQKN